MTSPLESRVEVSFCVGVQELGNKVDIPFAMEGPLYWYFVAQSWFCNVTSLTSLQVTDIPLLTEPNSTSSFQEPTDLIFPKYTHQMHWKWNFRQK